VIKQVKCARGNIDAIAVTYSAGRGGSLLIGALAARTLAIVKKKPLYAVNHVEGHVYTNFLTSTSLPGYVLPTTQPAFPMLALIISGKLRNSFYSATILNTPCLVGHTMMPLAKLLIR
jgi:N6-L-threonylcarbamoyladenine synthase